MIYDGIKLSETSVIDNAVIASGDTLPTEDNNLGELFYLVGSGLHVFNGVKWVSLQKTSNDGSGVSPAIPLPSETTFVYNEDGDIETMREAIGNEEKITTFMYMNGLISQIITVFMGSARVESFFYDSNNSITRIEATEE